MNIDSLVRDAVFGDANAKAAARKQIHVEARKGGAASTSIFPLYTAIGRGEMPRRFTVPAFNIRALTYDSARALFRAAMRHNVGAFIFEIARSEIGYTEQRPAEYAACVLGAAIREGFHGPVFIQGDHFQASAKKWATEQGRAAETKALESLIDEAIAAEFYNIDIDTSTLVDLDFPTRDEQQRANYEGTAHLTKYIRAREPKGVEISVGGEIGEVGKYNTQPDEVRAYVDGLRRLLGDATGIQNMILDAPTLPQQLKDEIRDFCFADAADERKPGETDEQFVYKTRKKALGPLKRRLWDMGDQAKGPIIRDLETKFEFLMEKLGVFGTRDIVAKYVPISTGALPAYAAASAELTAAATVDPNEGE